MDKSELLEISDQIKSLESKRKELIQSVMKAVRKPITEWAATLPAEEFKVALKNLYVESHNKHHGTDYFTWQSTEYIQDKFESYVKMIMEGDCEEEGKLHENLVRYIAEKYESYELCSKIVELIKIQNRDEKLTEILS